MTRDSVEARNPTACSLFSSMSKNASMVKPALRRRGSTNSALYISSKARYASRPSAPRSRSTFSGFEFRFNVPVRFSRDASSVNAFATSSLRSGSFRLLLEAVCVFSKPDVSAVHAFGSCISKVIQVAKAVPKTQNNPNTRLLRMPRLINGRFLAPGDFCMLH